MGSSKKKKEKKRSRSRSPAKEDRSSRKRRHREVNPDQADEIPQTSSITDGATREKRRKKEENDDYSEMAVSSGGGCEISMSIDETNKLRAQLGLAPLQVDNKTVKEVESEDGQTMEVVKVDGKEFVHKPAENWGAKKQQETIREKLQALREKRKLDEKLGQVKLLGEADEDDSAAAWVEKSRRLNEEKRLAEKREKMLQEMDQQFGVSEMIAEKKKTVSKKGHISGYGSKDLAGMTVEHSKDVLLQSQETVLVLKDKDVLDESEDILVNPTISELQQWKKNAELRKQKPGYNPYEEDLDEFGMPKRTMLSKYDEEIEGEKRDSFKLGAHGDADIRAERERAEMLAKLREGAETLEGQTYQIANEYMTQEEMAKFKKPKKRVKKLRKRGEDGLKADDLLSSANTIDEDFGSRNRGRGRKKTEYEAGHMETTELDRSAVKKERDEEQEPMETSAPLDDDLDNIVLSDDEAEQELQAALARARQLQRVEAKKIGVEKVIELLPKSEPDEENESEVSVPAGKIVMDAVSEYCRGLGDIPTYGMAGNREDVDDDDLIDVEREKLPSTSRIEEDEQEDDDEEEEKGGWHERDINDLERPQSSSSSAGSDDEASREPILGEEPDMNNMGVGAALKLAVQKGYVKKDDGNRGGMMHLDHLKAQRYTIMDKQFHDIDDKYAKKLERMGGGGGPIVEFKEKSDYKPDVKLEYSDEKGRLLDQKDAFRYLSWKFHGKVPGKQKVEKRNKKLLEKELFNEMSSTDTPLGTLSKQIEKQRQLQTPFILLSGTGSKDVGTSIKKD